MSRQLVARAPDSHHPALDPGTLGCSQPGRPSGERRGPGVEGGREASRQDSAGVDPAARKAMNTPTTVFALWGDTMGQEEEPLYSHPNARFEITAELFPDLVRHDSFMADP